MPSLLDDAYSTADVLSRIRPVMRRDGLDVQTLSGRERRSIAPPELPDPYDATAAMALGAVDVLGIPSAIAGLYSRDLRERMRGPQERYQEAAIVGSIPSLMAMPWARLSPAANPNAWRAGLFGLGVSHKPTSTSELD